MNERLATWDLVGTDVSNSSNLEEVLSSSGLDYTVSKKNIYLGVNKRPKVEGRVGIVRDTDNYLYGIVGENYEICQNRDAFDFVNYIDSDVEYVRAGETSYGLIYVIAKMEESTILGDTFSPYVIFQNGHNGGISVKAAICPLRYVCQNQFSYSFENTSNAISIRHDNSMNTKLKEATNVLRSTKEYMNELNRMSEKYASVKFDEKQLKTIIDEFFPIKPEMSIRKLNSIQEKKDIFISRYMEDDNQNFRGTAWGLINAYSDYITHMEPSRKTDKWAENKFISSTFNSKIMNNFVNFVDYKLEA